MRLPRSILDRAFEYTPSAKTDLKRTFKRIRREHLEDQQRDAANAQEAQDKVKQLKGTKT
jgi:hypothetical protein